MFDNTAVSDLMIDVYSALKNSNSSEYIMSDDFRHKCAQALGRSDEEIRKGLQNIIEEQGWKDDYIKCILNGRNNKAQHTVNVELSDWVMVDRNPKEAIGFPSWLPSYDSLRYLAIYKDNGDEIPMYGFGFNDIEICLLGDGYDFIRYNDSTMTQLIYYKKPANADVNKLTSLLSKLVKIFEKHSK